MGTQEAIRREELFLGRMPAWTPRPGNVLDESLAMHLAPEEFDPTLETCFMAGYDHMPELLDDTPSPTYIRDHGPDTILFAIKLGALVAEYERSIGLYSELPAEMRLEQPALNPSAPKRKRQAIRLRKVTK